MSKSFFRAVLAAATMVFGGTAGLALAADGGGRTVSAAAAKTLAASKNAADAKNFGEAIAKANETLANGKKTPYDTLVAYQLLTYSYAQQNNGPETIKALEGQINTGQLGPSEQSKVISTMAGLAFQQRNYPQAVEFGNRLIRSGAAGADTYTLVAQSYYQQNKFGDASKFLREFVNDQERRGQAPKENTLVLLRAASEKAGDKGTATDALEKLVIHYPKADYWDNLLYTLRRDPQLNERQKLHVYRLMQATQTLKQGGDYIEMADISVNAGMPGEAQRVLEQGLAANAFPQETDKARAQRALNSSKNRAAADRAGLPKVEAEAKALKTGELDYALGVSLFGYGEYARSAEALTRGIGKGGIKNASEAQMILGIAQLRAGSKADSVRTFRGIKTEDAITQRISKLWALYAQ